MTRNLVLLGSTGSIGRQTLKVAEAHPGRFRILGMAAHTDGKTLYEQALKFKPVQVCLTDEGAAEQWRPRFEGEGIQFLAGPEGAVEIARHPEAHMAVAAMAGIAGLPSTFAAAEAGKDVALANKESLVTAGNILKRAVEQGGGALLPMDSEHNALFQCLNGVESDEVKQVILTASGGPFRGYTREQLGEVTWRQAIDHPTWSMGRKISVDSATLMNKGLEVIEAMHLFDLPVEQVGVVVHPESVVHGLVEMVDGAFLAHLTAPDMAHAIQNCLTWPRRLPGAGRTLDLVQMGSLNFMEPDNEAFPALGLAYRAAQAGGSMPAVMNGANEAAVAAFLEGRVSFPSIARVIEYVMDQHDPGPVTSIEEVLTVDQWARRSAVKAMTFFE